MERRSVRTFRSDSGVAAVEFALIVPILCIVCFGIVAGWSYVSSSLAMRAGVKTAANLIMEGAADDAATRAVALSSWQNHPADAQLTLARIYMCGSTATDAT